MSVTPRVSNNTPAEGPCGVTVKDVPAGDFIVAYAAHLKRTGKIELPKWSDLVKTSKARELAPYDPDWYYVRAAAIARRVYLRGNVGVGAMRKIYGGRQRRGTVKEKFALSGGSIPRHIFAQLEKMKILEKAPATGKGGRRITETGQRDLDSIAGQIKSADK
ncbi:hypothetical protein KFE25_003673 [Diacronema lutheri]|uniref:40S ribosomal protein S19 n=1 Tax=Diacronema lutheri TaxID=2081491 RepID=A0A8J5XI04_DIALT|nr:hypothetical protein KFE25_003673 [Diacronema lutheri]